MHYYPFNIGDYYSHTGHLDLLEDLAYRRMLDYCYLNEIGLPESVDEIARLIRMRTHCECIANVLREFFTVQPSGGWRSERVDRELAVFRDKSSKASTSARKRWENSMRTHSERNANAMPTQCEGNANQEPITNNQEPINNKASDESPAPPKEKKKGKPLITLSTYLAERKTQGLRAFDENCAADRYADEINLPDEFLQLAWREFRFQHIDGDRKGKRQKDWPATFANAVRGNWYKLWWLNSANTYELTTNGKQAQLAMQTAAKDRSAA